MRDHTTMERPSAVPAPMQLTRREARRIDRRMRRASATVAALAGDRLTLRERVFGVPRDQSTTAATPGTKGWLLNGAGRVNYVAVPPEAQGTSVHVCGLWPFALGTGAPVVGVPLGRNLLNRSTVCADPIQWFQQGLINNPSCFILGRPHLGKSALVKRIITVLSSWGIIPMVLSDTKGEYTPLIAEIDGQTIRVGRGRSAVNPLDMLEVIRALEEIPDPTIRAEALEEMRGRRLTTFLGLLTIARDGTLGNHEQNLITAALSILDRQLPDRAPLIDDVADLIRSRPQELADVVRDRGDRSRYEDRTEQLLDTLGTLTGSGGVFGDMFARHTTEQVQMGQPFSFDLSGIPDSDVTLLGAVQSVCWNYGSALVSAQKYLAEAGLRPFQHYFLVMDELWLALRASNAIVFYLDALTRLNRQRGIGQTMITHTMNDLKLATDELTTVAWGFVERSAMVFLGGLSEGEMGNLSTVFSMTRREKSLITDWSGEGAVSDGAGKIPDPPGRGKFLLKVGKRPGTPFKLHLTDREKQVFDTNKHWTESDVDQHDELETRA